MIKFYRRYQSLKKFGGQETDGIEMGKSYVFPKIDGHPRKINPSKTS